MHGVDARINEPMVGSVDTATSRRWAGTSRPVRGVAGVDTGMDGETRDVTQVET